MKPGNHRIEFRYTALSLVAPEKTLFRCRLEGLEADWVDVGGRREAFYTGIPYGQPVNTNGYVGYGISLEDFDAAMRDNTSKLNTSHST